MKNELNNAGIYEIRFKRSKKKYIGSTSNFQYRKQQHLSMLKRQNHCNPVLQNAFNKYGKESFIFTVLEIIEDISLLFIREQYYINQYVFTDLYNIIENVQCNFKPVKVKQICRDTGLVIKTFHSISDAETKCNINNISAVLSGKQKSSGGFYWAKEETIIDDFWLADKEYKTVSKCVLQIDMNTLNIIKEYSSLTQAAIENGLSFKNISAVCRNKERSAGGFYWKFKDDKTPIQTKKLVHKINQYDLAGNFIRTWSSAKEIAIFYDKCDPSYLYQCLSCLAKSAYGYKWQYFDKGGLND